jgi:hypothetical protein
MAHLLCFGCHVFDLDALCKDILLFNCNVMIVHMCGVVH